MGLFCCVFPSSQELALFLTASHPSTGHYNTVILNQWQSAWPQMTLSSIMFLACSQLYLTYCSDSRYCQVIKPLLCQHFLYWNYFHTCWVSDSLQFLQKSTNEAYLAGCFRVEMMKKIKSWKIAKLFPNSRIETTPTLFLKCLADLLDTCHRLLLFTIKY